MSADYTSTERVLLLNTAVFPVLGRIMLGMTNTELMEAIGISSATWYLIVRHPNEMDVQQQFSIATDCVFPLGFFSCLMVLTW